MRGDPRPRLAIISSQAASLANFRGPLIRALAAWDVRVFALAPDFDADSRGAVRALGAEPVDYSLARTGLNPVRDAIDTLRLARRLRTLNVDATLAYFIKPVIYGTIAAFLAGVSRRFALVEGMGYVFTEGTQPTTARRALRRIAMWMYSIAFARSEKVFLLNDDDAQWLASAGIVTPEKIVRLDGIGLDLDHWRQQALPPSPPMVFLLVARLLREKGIAEYADAARLIKREYPTARFILAGDLDANPGSFSRDDVTRWTRDGLIEWVGHVSDVRLLIAQAHVFVLPSYREGLPRSTQEAMASGRAVITTDVPGCRSTVRDGANGFLVPPRDPQALAAAMRRFVESPSLLAPFGDESRRMAERRFDAHTTNAIIMRELGLG